MVPELQDKFDKLFNHNRSIATGWLIRELAESKPYLKHLMTSEDIRVLQDIINTVKPTE